MKYRICTLSELVNSPYNPPQRTDKGISALATNIRKNGLLQPIVVADEMTIIDGHRRRSALEMIAKSDGIKPSKVKVSIIQHNSKSEELYDALFISSNKDTMLLNGHQYLWRYMKGAEIPKTHLSRIKCLEKWLGKKYARGMFRRILDNGHSANTYQMCIGIYRTYTSKTTSSHMRKVAYYLLNVENCFRVKAAIANFIPVDTLVKCVNNKKQIVTEFSVGN
tara:strand:- start:1539 stop:2204 length:666 start_codon:yes stop_codon:yes gene_type:complete